MERNAPHGRGGGGATGQAAGRVATHRRGLVMALVLGALLLGACVPAVSRAGVPLVVAAPLAQLTSPLPPGRIVFVASGDLWLWADGAVRQLTSGERYEGPAWSPDGELLAASLVGVNHSDLVLLSAEGELLQRLTDNRGRRRIQESDWARMPAWAPDGSRIAFASDIRTYDLALWSIGPDGHSPRQLFLPPDYHGGVDRPTWSPSGDEIAMAVWRDGRGQIEVLNLATGRTRRLTDVPNGAYDPAWSPTGHWIAYVARDGARHDIWLVAPEGGASVRLTTSGRNRMPAWSPDGTWLAFLSLNENGFDVRAIPVAAEAAEVAPGEGRVLVSAYPVEGPAGLTWGP